MSLLQTNITAILSHFAALCYAYAVVQCMTAVRLSVTFAYCVETSQKRFSPSVKKLEQTLNDRVATLLQFLHAEPYGSIPTETP